MIICVTVLEEKGQLESDQSVQLRKDQLHQALLSTYKQCWRCWWLSRSRFVAPDQWQVADCGCGWGYDVATAQCDQCQTVKNDLSFLSQSVKELAIRSEAPTAFIEKLCIFDC